MHAGRGRRRQVLDDVVAIAHGIKAVGNTDEAEIAGEGLAVDREGPGERRRAQRQHVGAGGGGSEAFAVALEHEHVREQMVSENDRLGALQCV